MSNKIFTYTFTGIKTGWEYKLSMFGASVDLFVDPEIIELPPGVINMKNMDAEFEDYPVGATTFPQMEIEINLQDLPTELDADFYPLIFDPVLPMTQYIDGVIRYVLEAGTVFKLDVLFYGNDENNLSRTIFIGIHKDEVKSRKTPNITIIDWRKTIFETVPWFWVGLTSSVDDLLRNYCYEYAFQKDNLAPEFVGQHANGLEIKFKKLSHIIDRLNYYASDIAKKLLRDNSASFEINFPNISFYKQNYLGDGTLGSLLNINDIYLISYVKLNGSELSGAFVSSDDKSLFNLYPNSIWDFLVDFAENFLHKIISVSPYRIDYIPIYGYVASEQKVVADILKLNNLEITFSSNVIRTVTASLNEIMNDEDDYEDKANWELVNSGTRNESEYTIPVIFNNLPSCVKYRHVPGLYAAHPSKIKTLNLYYFDNPYNHFIENQALRIHEYIKIKLADGIDGTVYSEAISQTTWNPKSFYNNGKMPEEAITELQYNDALQKLPNILANAFITTFGNKQLSYIEFEIDINEHTQFLGGGSIGFPWWQLDTVIQFNLNDLNQHYNVNYNKWYIVSSSIDFEKETAKIKAILRTI